MKNLEFSQIVVTLLRKVVIHLSPVSIKNDSLGLNIRLNVLCDSWLMKNSSKALFGEVY